MKIIEPNVEIIAEPDIYKRIELAGRTAYKSEDRITADSAKKFVQSMIAHGHESVLEHSNIVVQTFTAEATMKMFQIIHEYEQVSHKPSYIRNRLRSDSRCMNCGKLWSGNLRAWRSICKLYHGEYLLISLFGNNPLFDDIPWQEHVELSHETMALNIGSGVEHDPLHSIITARFTCSRGVSHELVRHRAMSFTQESSRYVSYNDVGVIAPYWYHDGRYKSIFSDSNSEAEHYYQLYRQAGAPPQVARSALNNDTKTEVVVTGTPYMWKDFLDLRTDKAAHPDIRMLAEKFRDTEEWKKWEVWMNERSAR